MRLFLRWLQSAVFRKWIVFFLASMMLLWLLLPLTFSPSFIVQHYQEEIPGLDFADMQPGVNYDKELSGTFPINWIISGKFESKGNGVITQGRPSVKIKTKATAFIRPPQLVAAVALLAIIFASTIFLSKNVSKASETPQRWRFDIPALDGSPDAALRTEMANAWLAANRFYNGSLYLLAAGVFMAFVGIGAFFFTLPDFVTTNSEVAVSPNKEQWELYALRSLRPFGMLIFVEAIAWFLLRQYRSATEDFKAFHRIYLRRSNYFVARKAYAELSTSDKSLIIGAALLAEDLSSRLSPGQTTEAIEAMKVEDTNPVFNILESALGRVSGKKSEAEAKGKPTTGDKDKPKE